MQIIIVHEKIHNETEEDAKNMEWFINISIKDYDGSEPEISRENLEIETMSDDLFDHKAPDWFN
jgi:hypothetical protein